MRRAGSLDLDRPPDDGVVSEIVRGRGGSHRELGCGTQAAEAVDDRFGRRDPAERKRRGLRDADDDLAVVVDAEPVLVANRLGKNYARLIRRVAALPNDTPPSMAEVRTCTLAQAQVFRHSITP